MGFLIPASKAWKSSCHTSASGTEVLVARGLGRRGKKTTSGSPQSRALRPGESPGMLSKFWEGHHLRCPEAAGSLVQRGRPISEGKEEMPDPGMGTEASRTTPRLCCVSDNPFPNHPYLTLYTLMEYPSLSAHKNKMGRDPSPSIRDTTGHGCGGRVTKKKRQSLGVTTGTQAFQRRFC